MAILSAILGSLSLVGYILFFLTRGLVGWLYWISILLGAVAVVSGFSARKTYWGKIGVYIGTGCVLIGVILFFWLSLRV